MNVSVGWMHQCGKGYLEGSPKEFIAENVSSKIPITVLYPGVKESALLLASCLDWPRWPSPSSQTSPVICCWVLPGVNRLQHLSQSERIACLLSWCGAQMWVTGGNRSKFTCSPLPFKCTQWRELSIVSEFKFRWTPWFFSLFLGRLEIKISNPTVKITNLF